MNEVKRLKRYIFDGSGNVSFLIKNNLFVENDFTDEEGGLVNPLNKLELMILQTAFFMAHKLNQEKKEYDATTEFSIRLKDFADLWLMEDSEKRIADGSLYTMVRRAIKKVDSRRFYYPDLADEKRTQVLSGYFSYVKYISSKENGASIAFAFPQPLIPYLQNHGQYTWYYFENIIKLQEYPNAIILYELFSKEKHLRQKRISKTSIRTDFTIENIRKRLSVADGYDITDTIRKIIKPAIEKINSETSINVKDPIIIKNGRTIESIGFEVEFSEADLNFEKVVQVANEQKSLLTEAQILKFSMDLCKDESFSSVYKKVGEDTFDYISRISDDLKDNIKVLEYYDYLKRLGLTSKRIEEKILNIK